MGHRIAHPYSTSIAQQRLDLDGTATATMGTYVVFVQLTFRISRDAFNRSGADG